MRWLGLVACVGAACHVTVHNDISRAGRVERVRHPEGAVARPPTLTLTDGNTLRFVEALDCPTEELVSTLTATEIETRPNVATVVVGAIAASAGAIMLTSAIGGKTTTGDPFFYAGLGLLGGGLPLAIGPFVGNHTELRPDPEAPPVRRPGPSEPCGERGMAGATAATLNLRGVEVRGQIDRDGNFTTSPFTVVDAFEAAASDSLDITAHVEGGTGPRTVVALIDGAVVAKHAADWIKHADFDGHWEQIQIVPGIVPGTLRVALTATSDGPAVRIVLPVRNDGPGPAWQLRGHVVAPATPAIDGRVLYFGAVAKGASSTRELLVPIARDVAAVLRNATIELSVELRDAHGTAPTTPVRYRGPIMVDAPRS